jgi:hypothetical protein
MTQFEVQIDEGITGKPLAAELALNDGGLIIHVFVRKVLPYLLGTGVRCHL